ncbi:MAG: chemotaxis protein CheW [Anaerolineales bacterium]|nr:chemotaxis protein CheW [Anaerolineales bacterium]
MNAVLIVQVAHQYYGLPLNAVVEVIPILAVTPVPNRPPDWLGVANIRGTLMPVIDARLHFGWPAPLPSLAAPLVILQVESQPLALLVDSVERIVHFSDDAAVQLYNEQVVVIIDPKVFFSKVNHEQT